MKQRNNFCDCSFQTYTCFKILEGYYLLMQKILLKCNRRYSSQENMVLKQTNKKTPTIVQYYGGQSHCFHIKSKS